MSTRGNLILIMTVVVVSMVLLTACSSNQESDVTSDKDAAGGNVEISEKQVDGIDMKYCRFGSGNKTMIILPGLTPGHVTDSAEAVAEEFDDFAQDFTVYLFDVKEDVPDDYTIEQMSDDTYTVIKSLGLSNLYLYGASMGGMQAICINSRHPDDVKKVFLASTLCRANDTFDEVITDWIDTAKTGDGMALEKCIAYAIYSESTIKKNGESLYSSGSELTDYNLKQFIRTARTIVDIDISDEAADLNPMRTYLACSKGDKLITHSAFEDMAQYVNDENVYLYAAEYGHDVYDEAPDFRKRILEFFLA